MGNELEARRAAEKALDAGRRRMNDALADTDDPRGPGAGGADVILLVLKVLYWAALAVFYVPLFLICVLLDMVG